MSAGSQGSIHFGREIDYLEDLGAKLRNLQGFTTLAHELLQNADDVPTVTRFTFNVCDDALIVENDGKFSDCEMLELDECPWRDLPTRGSHRCDFHRFRRVAGADKRNEAGTTGAFGIGFISVYQITDRPELISGRHWILDESQPSSQRITQCPGCEKCHTGNLGTRFFLPWASNPHSVIRSKLRAEPTIPETPTLFLAELERSLPTAMLFLKKLAKVEIKQNGRLIRCLEREGQNDSIILTDGDSANDTVWHLIRGEFDAKAQSLRELHPNRIERKRSADVVIAIPVFPMESGLICATLPTQQRTGLPFHINADFYPSEDRKRIILEQDFQSEWNRAALTSAAAILAGALDRLPSLLLHKRLWSLLTRMQQVSTEAQAGRTDKIYAQFWSQLAPALTEKPIVFTNQREWRKPSEVFYLQQESERSAIPVLESIGLQFVHEDLRLHQNFFTAAPISIRTLSVPVIVDALKQQGLTNCFQKGQWPEFLQKSGALRILWEELHLLLNRRRSTPLRAQHLLQPTVDSLSSLSLAASRDGLLCPCNTVYRTASHATELIFSRLDPTIRFATPETNSFPLFGSLCPEFGPAQACKVLGKLNADAFAIAVTNDMVSLASLFAWLVDHRTDILKDQHTRESLVGLPIFPSGNSYRPLGSLSLPGNFDDPLQLSALLDVKALPNHHDFLRDLGVQELSFPVYVTNHLAPALSRTDLSTDKRRAAIFLLASRRSEISENQNTKLLLASFPIVECADGKFYTAAKAYFPGQIVSDVLGSTVLQAKVPAEHETIYTELFKWLGVAEHPRFEDIVAHIKPLVATPPNPDSLTSILAIFSHLAARLQNEKASSALNELRTLAWLLGRNQSAKWFKPTELYATFQLYLFESQATFLGVDQYTQSNGTAFLTFLGIKSSPSVSQVVDHLLYCAKEKKPVNQEVYGFLNNKADDPVVLQLRSNPCLLLPDGQYINPGDVFWSDHPFGSYRKQLGPELRKYNDLFQKLGIRENPAYQDAQKVLSELTAEFGSRNRALDDAAHAVTLGCWRMLESALETAAIRPSELAALSETRCIPNTTHNLTPPSWVFFEDRAGLAAKFEGFLATNAIPRPLGASKAMAAAGVRTLATAVEVSLHECLNPVESPELGQRIQARRLQLARVLDAQATHTNTDEKLAQLDSIRFEIVEQLTISYKLNAFGRTLVSKQEDCPALFRAGENRLIFVIQKNPVPWSSIARELALALYPDDEPGRIASGLKEVLSAETADEAKAVLDELGFSTLEASPALPAGNSATIVALGGSITTEQPVTPPPASPPVATLPSNQPATQPPLTQEQPAAAGGGATQPVPSPTKPNQPGTPQAIPPQGSGGNEGTSGGKTTQPGQRQPRRGKLRSYVVKDPKPSDDPPDTEQHERRNALGDSGVAKVVVFEEANKRKPNVKPPRHPGYDIESCDTTGAIVRYIEVKSISGYWGPDGVGLTSTEFSKAQELGNDYWLYVVERADQPDYRIYCIQNPARKVNQFLYDDGWQEAAEGTFSADETQK